MPTTPDRHGIARAAAAWLVALTLSAAAAVPARGGPIEGTPPYPPSRYITEMTLDWDTFTQVGQGSDNWNTTWAADGNLYTAWGDGGGLGDRASRRAFVALGIARLTGDSAQTVRGVNLVGGLDPTVGQCFPHIPPMPREGARSTPDYVRPCYRIGSRAKTYGLLALDDRLYLFLSPGSSTTNLEQARLHVGPLGGNSWRQATWAFTKDDSYPLLQPVFVQAGRNHADLADYFYAYATRYGQDPGFPRATISIQKTPGRGGEIALLRVARNADLMNRDNWEFFTGLSAGGQPRWSRDQSRTKATLVDPNGVGWVSGAHYVKGLDRFILLTQHRKDHASFMSVFEAPNAWGPWSTVAYYKLRHPQGLSDPFAFYFALLANGFSADGTGFTLVFNGSRGTSEAMTLVDGRFTLDPARK